MIWTLEKEETLRGVVKVRKLDTIGVGVQKYRARLEIMILSCMGQFNGIV